MRHPHVAGGQFQVADVEAKKLVNFGLRALPLRHPWKQRRQRPFVGLMKLPQPQGRGTVPNTWASATERDIPGRALYRRRGAAGAATLALKSIAGTLYSSV